MLRRPKFVQRLGLIGRPVEDLIVGYTALATLVEPALIVPVVLNDPDDDAVLACAQGAHADAIVSGDRHLLDLESFAGIPILTVPALLLQLAE